MGWGNRPGIPPGYSLIRTENAEQTTSFVIQENVVPTHVAREIWDEKNRGEVRSKLKPSGMGKKRRGRNQTSRGDQVTYRHLDSAHQNEIIRLHIAHNTAFT